MPDVFTPQKRSEVMSRIRSTGNATTEGRLVALMRAEGIKGWRRQVTLCFPSAGAAGKSRKTGTSLKRAKSVRPDFVFRAERVAVFVDGCFWHGCPRHGRRPKSRQKFWNEKIERNQARDALVSRALRAQGWKVLRIWECALTEKRRKATLGRLARALGLGKEFISPAPSSARSR